MQTSRSILHGPFLVRFGCCNLLSAALASERSALITPLSPISTMKELKITIWVADDGREFRSEADCMAHERHCAEAIETELRLLIQVLASRVTNLFDEHTSVRDGKFPPELFESFDHCEFVDEFREFMSKNNLSPGLLVEQLSAFARLGALAQKMNAAVGERHSRKQILDDLALLPNLGICDIMQHLESLSRLGHIIANLSSERAEIIGYYWDHVESIYRAERDSIESKAVDWQMESPADEYEASAEWQEELANRDPFEGSPF